MTDPAWVSLSDVCRRLKSGEASVVEVTEQVLARIEALEPRFRAFAMVTADWARERALTLDAARRDGAVPGALFGVPIAVKDLLFTRGLATASGTLVMRDFVPEVSATVVERLLAAGAVIVGKTQLTEGAFGSHHPEIAPPVNPFDAAAWSGVSSSGSAVAVAAGMACGAIGSDTGGSIRFPSACCGLVGIKPSYGRVSRYGGFPLAESLDHFGPMTRSVEDAARMLSAIAGADERDPTCSEADVPPYAVRRKQVHELRLGVDWRYVREGVDSEVVARFETLVNRLEGAGARLTEVEVPETYRTLVEGWGITCGVECARAHAGLYPERAELYGPDLSALIELGRSAPTAKYAVLESERGAFRAALNEVLAGLDGILMPAMPVLPPPAQLMETGRYESEVPLITFTAPYDYSGHPTITVPTGLSDQGLPMSVQAVGPLFGETSLVDVGYAIESLFEPPCPVI